MSLSGLYLIFCLHSTFPQQDDKLYDLSLRFTEGERFSERWIQTEIDEAGRKATEEFIYQYEVRSVKDGLARMIRKVTKASSTIEMITGQNLVLRYDGKDIKQTVEPIKTEDAEGEDDEDDEEEDEPAQELDFFGQMMVQMYTSAFKTRVKGRLTVEIDQTGRIHSYRSKGPKFGMFGRMGFRLPVQAQKQKKDLTSLQFLRRGILPAEKLKPGSKWDWETVIYLPPEPGQAQRRGPRILERTPVKCKLKASFKAIEEINKLPCAVIESKGGFTVKEREIQGEISLTCYLDPAKGRIIKVKGKKIIKTLPIEEDEEVIELTKMEFEIKRSDE